MKIGTSAKVTIGIIGILATGITGFLISTHQLETTKAGEGQVAARTEQGGANALEKTLEAPAGQQSVVGEDEKEGWNALMGVLDEMEEAPDTRGTGLRSGAFEGTPSGTENSEISQDHPEMEYHEAYDTFIAIAKERAIVKAEMAPVNEEVKRLTDEWRRNVRDPKNRTEEERLVGEMRENFLPMWEEYQRLSSRLSSLTDSLFNEIEAAVPGAVQRESVDTPNGTADVTRVDYEQVRSALGALPEEHDTYLAELLTGFAVMKGEFYK